MSNSACLCASCACCTCCVSAWPTPVPRLACSLQALSQISGAVAAGGLAGGAAPAHVFAALHYLRRLCSHPLLVLDPEVPRHMQASTDFGRGSVMRRPSARLAS